MKNKIKEVREKLNMTQEELAIKSGISRTTISNLENNYIDVITSNTMIKISEALNKNLKDIFFI